MRDIVLTGLPRSGTTLTVWLLDKLPNVVALHEPIEFSRYNLQGAFATDELRRYFRDTRLSIVQERRVRSKIVPDSQKGNPFPLQRNEGQVRRSSSPTGYKEICKPLSGDFTLAVKHPMAFTALLPLIKNDFEVFATVRNPLSVLLSWQSVDAPVRLGRAHQAEVRSETLRALFERAGENVLARQIALLDWMFETYRANLAPERVIRYEDVIASSGRALQVVASDARNLNEPMFSMNQNPLYDYSRAVSVAERLCGEGSEWKSFYDLSDVEALLGGLR